MQDPTYQAYRNNLDDSDDMYIAMGCAEEEEIYTEMTGRGCGDVEEEEEEDIYENTTAFGQDSYSGRASVWRSRPVWSYTNKQMD